MTLEDSVRENETKPTAHTPGPWEVSMGEDVRAENGRWVAKMYSQGSISDAARIVAESEANARLIAAAPELLAALKGMLDPDGYTPVLAIARAAIAKAEGK